MTTTPTGTVTGRGSATSYTETGKTKCPACQRTVASVRSFTKTGDTLVTLPMVSRHLYQEQIELNEVGAPTEYAPGFCVGSLHQIKD